MLDLVIQPYRKTNGYAAFCELVDSTGASNLPAIFFANTGHASYNNYAHVIENGQYFLIHCNGLRTSKLPGCSVE